MMGVSVKATKMAEKAVNPRTGKRTLTKWRVCINMGRKDKRGRYAVKELTVNGGSEAEAIQAGYDWLRGHEGVTDFKGGASMFSAFADEWMRSREESGELTATTASRYRSIVKDLCGQLGALSVESVDVAAAERALSAIRAEKTARNGKEPSASSMRQTYIVLSQIMRRAEDWGYIPRNPCSKVKAPKIEETNRRSMTAAQAAQLRHLADDAMKEGYAAWCEKEKHLKETGHQNKHRESVRGLTAISYPLAVNIALATGMRRGEILGLVWRNVSLSDGLLRVEQSRDVHGNLKSPKTNAGRRTVAIDAHTAETLREWASFLRGLCTALKLTDDAAPLPGDFPVICSSSLGHVHPEAFSKWYREWTDDNGFSGWKLHELRHTHATQLIANGMDVKTVQTRMGHASPDITLSWYAKALPEKDKQAAALIGSMLDEAWEGVVRSPRLKVV